MVIICSSLKLKFIILLIATISSLMILTSVFLEENTKQLVKLKPRKGIPNVIVHIDLKGAPVKLSYLQTLLPMLRQLGVTGLLMEYEDMFPYENELKNLSAKNCYSKYELQKFLVRAKIQGFDIIPLIQTFGHMEHALKLSEFEHLREIPMYPDSICPSKKESLFLIAGIIAQVVQFHSKLFPLKYLHIGCDEVFNLNKCTMCLNRLLTDVQIYLDHVKAVTDIVNQFTPNTAVLVWDDMFREIPMSIWGDINSPKIELVYWDYRPSLSVSHITMMKYHNKFNNIWIASAYKGADGKFALVPNLENRFLNHYEWLKFIDKYQFGGEYKVYEFKGIILTGWSRYTHMDPPCELLPISIPSLVFNLILIKKFKTNLKNNLSTDLKTYKNSVENEVGIILNCSHSRKIESIYDNFNCTYYGNSLYHILKKLVIEKENIKNYIENELPYVNYYSKIKYINMNKVYTYLVWCQKTYNKISKLKTKFKKHLNQYYDNMFVEEYVGSKIYELQKHVYDLKNIFEDMQKVKSWSRGPRV